MPALRGLLPLLVIALLLLPAGTGVSQAAEEHVLATDGDDGGPGTAERPWRTLGHALRQLEPGDTLTVRGGTYREDLSGLPHLTPATPRAPITVRAAAGERPVVQGLLAIRGASYWTFDGINVTWDPQVGGSTSEMLKLMDGVGWTYRNAEVWGARSRAGVYVGSNIAGEPRDWRVEDNCIHDTLTANPGAYEDHNIYVQNGRGAGRGVIERNVVFNAPNGKNIKLGAGSPGVGEASNVAVRYNTLFNATENVLVAFDAHDITLERNLVGPINVDRSDYPNIRGYANTGSGVVARDNLFFGAPEFIRNTAANSTTPVDYGVGDGGGNRRGDPRFDSASCGGFAPRERGAFAFGARSPIERLADVGRIETSAALSRAASPRAGSAQTVVIARSDAYPDALAGAPLARKLGAPVILTTGDRLHSAAAAEIRRLGAQRAVLLGGSAALSERVVADLGGLGLSDVDRVFGANRFETARQIARLVADGVAVDTAYVVEGANSDPNRGWPDAVSVSGLAAQTGRPILLATRDDLPQPTRASLDELGIAEAVIVGGTAAVSAGVEQELADPTGDGDTDVSVTRYRGANRFETSLRVAEAAVEQGADPERTWLATGNNWPDALAAGPAAAADGGVLLLVNGASLDGSPTTRDWVRSGSDADRLVLVGGRGAIAPSVEDALAGLLGPR